MDKVNVEIVQPTEEVVEPTEELEEEEEESWQQPFSVMLESQQSVLAELRSLQSELSADRQARVQEINLLPAMSETIAQLNSQIQSLSAQLIAVTPTPSPSPETVEEMPHTDTLPPDGAEIVLPDQVAEPERPLPKRRAI
jgi:hypothetical protein